MLRFCGVFLAILLLSAGFENAGLQKVPHEIPAIGNSQRVSIDTDFGKIPLYFIPNKGQMDKQVAYYVQGKDKMIYFTPEGITFALTKPSPKDNHPSILDMVGLSQDLPQDEIEIGMLV